MRVAVLGGGNGAFAAAGDLALAGHAVRLWRRDAAAAEAHRAAGGTIVIEDAAGRHEAQLRLITGDIAAAAEGAELILCATPATAHADVAAALAPHLRSGQVVLLTPGSFGAFLFAKAARDAGNSAAATFAETATLPWLVRKHGAFTAAVTTRAARLPIGVLPLRRQIYALAVAARAFPGVVEPCGDALSAALLNAGPILHPPLITMNAAPLEHFPSWDIHKEGTQATVRRVIDALDAERIAVREALGYRAPHFPLADHYAEEGEEWMYPRGTHGRLTASGDWREAIALNQHRYMREDVGIGLSLLASVGGLAGVATPLAEAFLALGSAICGEDLAAGGRTLTHLGLEGCDAERLKTLLEEGLA
jgi:opine dehydrogenase